MQPNNNQQLTDIIDSVSDIIVALVVSDGCENFKSQLVQDFETKLAAQPIPTHLYTICYGEQSLPFPRPYTPAVYYFAPKTQIPLFYRLHGQMVQDVTKDVQTAKEMMSGKQYTDAAMDEPTRAQYMKTEEMLKTEDVSQFPPFFQQIRNLGKEMWNTGKHAAQGLPILADADTAFQRISTCQGCEFFKDDSRCEKCGCFMKTKTQLASATCPIGKW